MIQISLRKVNHFLNSYVKLKNQLREAVDPIGLTHTSRSEERPLRAHALLQSIFQAPTTGQAGTGMGSSAALLFLPLPKLAEHWGLSRRDPGRSVFSFLIEFFCFCAFVWIPLYK